MDALKVAPDVYSLLMGNDRVRVLSVKFKCRKPVSLIHL